METRNQSAEEPLGGLGAMMQRRFYCPDCYRAHLGHFTSSWLEMTPGSRVGMKGGERQAGCRWHLWAKWVQQMVHL